MASDIRHEPLIAGMPLRRSPLVLSATALILAPVIALLAAGCDGLVMEDTPENGVPGSGSDDLGADAPEDFATDLNVPWEIRFLPGGDLLITERPGDLVRLSADGDEVRRDEISGVRAEGESGLMGLALDPGYEQNGRIYICYTTETADGVMNHVDRLQYGSSGPSDRATILDDMRGSDIHDGCRLEFGPDGYLFVSMGDAADTSLAQDQNSLNGKILRIDTDGGPAPGNPFDDEIYSLGHRNPQGLAFDASGRLWSTEHGPSAEDEINLVIQGSNYGWPEITGEESAQGMVTPVAQSGGATWAPAGAAWVDSRLFFAGLRGASLYEIPVSPDAISPTAQTSLSAEVSAHFSGEFGRLRAVRVSPDGRLYFSTSNRDGRGDVREGDDRILVVDPAAIE